MLIILFLALYALKHVTADSRTMNLFRFFIILSLAGFNTDLQAQKKYTTRNAKIDFTSEAQLELIQAVSSKVRGLIDPTTNQFAFTIDVNSFEGFNSSLQREHFNEKYMESEKFPMASFSGKIIEQIDFSKNGSYDVRAKGDLDIHGVKQTRIIKGKISVTNGKLDVNADFDVPLSDHNISIPTVVSKKIATQIKVQFQASMLLQ
jgi:polyisoprenoid-binding protein YceI